MRARGRRKRKESGEEKRGRADPPYPNLADNQPTETIKFQSLSHSKHTPPLQYSVLGRWGDMGAKPLPTLPRSTKNGQRNSGADCYAREIRSEPFVPSHSDTNQFKGDLKNLSRIPQFSETTQTGGAGIEASLVARVDWARENICPVRWRERLAGHPV